MHQPSTAARPSLYFDYRVHPAWLPAGLHQAVDEAKPVVIVGAGPAGLVTALGLAQQGVPCVVLNADVQVSQGSRAIVFTRRTLEILQQAGIADRLVAMGLPWWDGQSFYRGQSVYRMQAPRHEHDRFAPMLNLQQPFVEAMLVEACAAHPIIELRWGNLLTGLRVQADDAGAVLTVDTPAGAYELPARWVVAADGGRSTVRSLMNLKLEGASYEGNFVIADIKIDLPYPTERRAYFDPPWNPGNTILMHREPLGIWRVDYQLPPGESAEAALQPASMQARIDAQLAMIGHAGTPWTLDWCSVYSARTLTLPRYVEGPVLFVGDAAHLLPIFGVRGANTAFQDAQSLAWHLALVVRGVAPRSLLQNFSDERVGAAREIIDEAGKSTRFMAPPSDGFRLLRDAVLSLSLTQDFVRPLYHWRTSRPHEYTHSSLHASQKPESGLAEGLRLGAPPLNVKLGEGRYLLDGVGQHFDLLVFTDASSIDAALLAVVRRHQAAGVPLRVLSVGARPHVEGADAVVHDPSHAVAKHWGVAVSPGHVAAYLLRPDQHVCARWSKLDAQGLEAALLEATHRQSKPTQPVAIVSKENP